MNITEKILANTAAVPLAIDPTPRTAEASPTPRVVVTVEVEVEVPTSLGNSFANIIASS